MATLRSLLLLALLACGLAACTTGERDTRGMQPIPAKLVAQMREKGMKPSDPIMIRIYKQESELEVWKRDRSGNYALLKTYPICRWSGKLGPKKQEGDRQAPEGFYAITMSLLNPQSQFYLSFNLGFPNKLEEALGYEGAALMVHGACSSSGCYALTDAGVAEIYAVARDALIGGQTSFQVQSLPFRMTPQNLALHRNDPNMNFWLNLKQGTDQFDVTRQPPKVEACNRRYVFGAKPLDPGAAFDPLGACPAYEVDPSVAAKVAVKQARDDAQIASLAAAEPPLTLAYSDGGMNEAFREILKTSGPEKLSRMTSAGFPVSRPSAALADPYQPLGIDPMQTATTVAGQK
ncbi:MAG TPA: murein L,D-transpeptidase family protein [Kaistia sp.]|nr:murein L,D-transpeptidase family protein [Kaistia sp.]